MRIKCVANKGADLPEECLDPSGGFTREHKFALEIGKEYNVYAITLFRGYVWYYICDEDYSYYPVWNPSPLFEVVDGKLSKFWRFNFIKEHPHYIGSETIFAFEEWANDPYSYYDKLTDGDEAEVSIFKRYKNLMDVEFPVISNEKRAKDIGDNWVMCPDCDETWQASSENGMLWCPKCNAFLHNPYYR